MSKSKILLVDDEDEILDILEILIESEFDVSTLRASSGNEAIALLKKQSDIDLVISDYSMNLGSGGDLFYYNKSNSNLPFLLVSGGFLQDYRDMSDLHSVNKLNGYVQKPIDEKELFSLINKALTIEVGTSSESCQYKRVRIDHAIYFLKNNKDIFLNISSGKFIKIINEGELDCTNELLKYKDKGESYIYIQSDDFEHSMKDILATISSKVQSGDSFASSITIGAHGYDFVHSSLIDMGLTDEHVELINSVVNRCVCELMKKEKQKTLLTAFFKDQGYLVSHSMTCIYVSFLICGHLDYSNESVIEKLTYASLLHDLGLSDSSLSEVLSKDSHLFKDLSQRNKKQVLNHMFESVKLLESFEDIPNDVEAIILEHHENASGTGFPRGLSASRISSLGAIFILSLRFSDFLFFKEFKEDNEEFITDLKSDFDKGVFKKPLVGLISSMKKAQKD